MNRPHRQPSGWRTFGIVLACVVGACGLLMLGLIVLLYVGMASYGSNK